METGDPDPRFPADTTTGDELTHAEQAMTDAALHALEQTATADGIPASVRDQVAREIRAASGEHADSDDAMNETARNHAQASRLRLTAVTQKREVLNRLRRDGSIDDAVALRLQTRLDVEELRLTGVDDPFT